MSGTEIPAPPPLLRAAALLKRAGTHAANMEMDVAAALKVLEAARDSLPEEQRYLVAHLLTGSRVRLLDASTGRERLPVLASWAEELAPRLPLPAPAVQEGGGP
jgi:hypothetical protein